MDTIKNLENLRYPIGHFQKPLHFDLNLLENAFATIEIFPKQLRNILKNANKNQLNHQYRPDGWIVKQVIHHCADSHINAFIRTKLALTETNPTIKPYDEGSWANLLDGNLDDIEPSLLIIEGVHSRWIALLRSLNTEQLQKTYYHPENEIVTTIFEAVLMYDWHCRHHLKHIEIGLLQNNKYF